MRVQIPHQILSAGYTSSYRAWKKNLRDSEFKSAVQEWFESMKEAQITQLKRDDIIMTSQLAKADVELKHKDDQIKDHAKSISALQTKLDSTRARLKRARYD